MPGLNSWSDAVKVKRAWGEVTLPFGVLQAGRMGALVNWGTGFFVNDGACASCDHGDSGDRIALTVPLLGHYLSGVYELSASGPYVVPFAQPVNLERRAQVQTGALSFYRFDSVEAQRRIVNAGRTLVQYGLLASYRSQELDAPAWLQPGGLVRGYGPPDFLRRGVKSFAGDVWLLVHHKGFRAELEAATVLAWIDDASNLPGVAFRQPVTAYQFGGVASLSYKFRFPLKLRAEVGFASGDDAPGFGVRVANGQTSTQKGDLDGPQLRPPGDTTINNFRFHPDYHVDLILWRRLIGQVTDAVYVRPSIVAGPFGSAMNAISFEAAVINSNAVYATTPPGQERALGTELNLLARYRYEPSFEIGLSYGVLFPGAGFRNLALALDAKPAQALELLLIYRI